MRGFIFNLYFFGLIRQTVVHLSMELRQIPERTGLSQREIAKMANIGQSTLSDYFTGRRGAAESEVIEKILEVTGLAKEQIIFSPENPLPVDGMSKYWANVAYEAAKTAEEHGARLTVEIKKNELTLKLQWLNY